MLVRSMLAVFICWTIACSSVMAFEVHGAIGDKWRQLGAASGPLGQPLSDELPAFGGGRFNSFQFGFIYWHPRVGAHAVYGAIGQKWNQLGREQNFGYPVTDEQPAINGGRFNDFEGGGSIYWHNSFGAHAVIGAISLKWAELRREAGPLGYPVSDEAAAADGVGRFSDFQSGVVYWHPNVGAHAVYGAIGQRWIELGRETGSCGYPTSDEYADSDGSRRSDFQYGSIHLSSHGVTVKGCRSKSWGTLASPGFERSPIRTILFFAGQQLDGRSLPQNNCPALPDDITSRCSTVWPSDKTYLDWINPQNRIRALARIAGLGFNTISMSTWGESSLPCSASCSDVPAACCGKGVPDPTCHDPVPKCYVAPDGNQRCRIGWYGSANTQLSPAAKNELFDAATTQTILIMPFIESRFEHDWNFRTDFPTSLDPRERGALAPGLISQIEDLIATYLTRPANPRWPDKWALVYDQHGEKRHSVVIVQASSDSLARSDDQRFAESFDQVAEKIDEDTHIRIGFFIDPVPRDPVLTPACPGSGGPLRSSYVAAFRPDPSTTGSWLAQQSSILGIHAYSPEGWIDSPPQLSRSIDECVKLAWKQDYSQRWFATGIPFLQDVTAGYDGTKLFSSAPGLHRWGYSPSWHEGMKDLVARFGSKGFVYNSWNGYCEGLAGMETMPETGNIDLIRELMGLN
jgi:hypothetical protein